MIDVLHLNEEEAEIISGGFKADDLKVASSTDKLKEVTNRLHLSSSSSSEGCAIVLLSLGSKGTFISVTPNKTRLANACNQISSESSSWEAGSTIHIPAFAIPEGQINTNGAGDALFSGFCYALATTMETKLTMKQVGEFASLVAYQRCNINTRDKPSHDVDGLLDMVLNGNLPPTIQ